MKMTIKFDRDKLFDYGLTEEEAMEPIREFFERKRIPEVSDGVFSYAGDEKLGSFGCAMLLPEKHNYFLDCVKTWLWYFDDHTEDCKKEYIKAKSELVL